MLKITNIEIIKILNSGGKDAIQTTIILNKKHEGIASTPSAIIPGKREVNTTIYNNIYNSDDLNSIINELYKMKVVTQQNADEILQKYIDIVGSDICLSISLALARAISKSKGISLINYIERISKIKSKLLSPYPLVGIFSGGVHDAYGSIQQIFISVNTHDFNNAIDIITTIYNEIENYLKDNDKYYDLGASSGFITKNMTPDEKFELLQNTIKKHKYENTVSLGIDVAAEHLYKNDLYFYQGKEYNSSDFYNLIQKYQQKYNLTFIEDPFDTLDKANWNKFKKTNIIDIVGDDLFATQEKYIDSSFANAIIIKMNQAGTLTKTIQTVNKALNEKMKLCVSHRSYETEDTFMCDLAIAINSDYIKIGGPKRGDRISKYNRIINIIKNTQN